MNTCDYCDEGLPLYHKREADEYGMEPAQFIPCSRSYKELEEQYEGEKRAHVGQARYEQGRYARLKEQFEALDDAIRDALDFLTGWNGQGKIDPEIAKDILNAALEKHGAQLLSNPAKKPDA